MAKAKYIVRCDMEGVTGVVSMDQVTPEGPEYGHGRLLFMEDLLALVDGLLSGGADQIVIYDEHYYGRNIDLAMLPPQVTAICGKPPYTRDWPGGFDESFAGMILLGLHAMRGVTQGTLAHTYEPDIHSLMLNGMHIGEIGMEAAVAGDYGVPVLMVTADSKGIEEAQALLPGVRGVAVKQSRGETGAVCLPPATTSEMIRDAAAECVSNPPAVKPFTVGDDVTLDIALNDGAYLNSIQRLFSDQLVDQHTLRVKGDSATAVWADYWQLKLEAQAQIA